jgi:hypothetical protein
VEEVTRRIEFGQKCPKCGSFKHELDESKLILVPKSLGGSLRKRFQSRVDQDSWSKSVSFLTADGVVRATPAYQGIPNYLGVYELRQAIVNSGIWSRSQLSSYGLFSQHELEVNDRQFCHVRPHSCPQTIEDRRQFFIEAGFPADYYDNRWRYAEGHAFPELPSSGKQVSDDLDEDSWQAWGFDDSSDEDQKKKDVVQTTPKDIRLTDVETEFISGNPVRTGFRKRSKAARKRRAAKRTARLTRTYKFEIPGDFQVREVNLLFKYRPQKGRDTRHYGVKRGRGYRARCSILRERWSREGPRRGPLNVHYRPPKGALLKKYCYFFRKRGSYYLSLHHPVKGDRGVV